VRWRERGKEKLRKRGGLLLDKTKCLPWCFWTPPLLFFFPNFAQPLNSRDLGFNSQRSYKWKIGTKTLKSSGEIFQTKIRKWTIFAMQAKLLQNQLVI
jgi:hypothetical protein